MTTLPTAPRATVPQASDFKPLESGPWLLWADRRKSGRPGDATEEYYDIGEKWWTQMHGPSHLVPVQLVEDNEGNYWGWMDSRNENREPAMVWPSRAQFAMCFAYGPEAQVESLAARGHVGKILRLKVIEQVAP